MYLFMSHLTKFSLLVIQKYLPRCNKVRRPLAQCGDTAGHDDPSTQPMMRYIGHSSSG